MPTKKTLKQTKLKVKKKTASVTIPHSSRVWSIIYIDEKGVAEITQPTTLGKTKKLLEKIRELSSEAQIICFPTEAQIN